MPALEPDSIPTFRSAPRWVSRWSVGTFLAMILAALVMAATTVVAAADSFDGPVIISEFQAANSTTTSDADGDSSDWIELHNISGATVQLDGWTLRDDSNQWSFPAIAIAPGEYLIVWASGKDRISPELHTNFKLSAAGESLALLTPAGQISSGYLPTYPPQPTDYSYGYSSGAVGYFGTPTPGAANGSTSSGPALSPVAATDRGVYSASFVETLTTATPGGQIRYTLDGSEPTETSTVYTGGITIDASLPVVTIRARTYAPGYDPSPEASWSYVFPQSALPDYPVAAPYINLDLPIVILNDFDGGTFQQSDPPRRGRLEYLDPNGPGFSIGAGFATTGASGPVGIPDSSRIHFDSEFGASKLEYPVFDDVARAGGIRPTTTFDKLDLRNFSNDAGGSWTGTSRPYYISDLFWKNTILDLGEINPHGRFVHAYRGGEYAGVMHLREMFGAAFHADYDRGDKGDYAAMFYPAFSASSTPSVTDGEVTDWRQVFALRRDYQKIKDHIDVSSFIAEAFYEGWVGRNREREYRVSGRRWGVDAGQWITMQNDNDWEVGRVLGGIPLLGNNRDWVAALVYQWTDDPEFRLEVSRLARTAFCPGGAMSTESMLARFDESVAELDKGIIPTMILRHRSKWESALDNTRRAHADARALIAEHGPGKYQAAVDEGYLTSCTPEPAINVRSSMQNLVGEPVSYTVPALAADGTSTVTYSAMSLPAGLSIDAATGLISGAPTSVGDYTVTITVRDTTTGQSVSDSIHWSITSAASPVVLLLNEYNAVATAKQLGDGAGSDGEFGTAIGNGGDWMEFVVVETSDLRGVQIELWDRDRSGSVLKNTNTLIFSEHELMAAVPAGSIITISEDRPDDLTLDPASGDWHINAGVDNLGQSALFTFASQANFDTNNDIFHVLVRSASGEPLGNHQGETDSWRSTYGNITDVDVFAVCANPPAPTAPTAIEAVHTSTYGHANVCSGHVQSLAGLRGTIGDVSCDGDVTEADVVHMLEYFVGLRASSGCPLSAPDAATAIALGDADQNGEVDLRDAQHIAQCASGHQTSC